MIGLVLLRADCRRPATSVKAIHSWREEDEEEEEGEGEHLHLEILPDLHMSECCRKDFLLPEVDTRSTNVALSSDGTRYLGIFFFWTL